MARIRHGVDPATSARLGRRRGIPRAFGLYRAHRTRDAPRDTPSFLAIERNDILVTLYNLRAHGLFVEFWILEVSLIPE